MTDYEQRQPRVYNSSNAHDARDEARTMDTITAYIDFHADASGVLYDADGWVIGTYTVADRFRQQRGEYATIHACIDGKRYEGTKFERSRHGQVRLSRTPWNDDEPSHRRKTDG